VNSACFQRISRTPDVLMAEFRSLLELRRRQMNARSDTMAVKGPPRKSMSRFWKVSDTARRSTLELVDVQTPRTSEAMPPRLGLLGAEGRRMTWCAGYNPFVDCSTNEPEVFEDCLSTETLELDLRAYDARLTFSTPKSVAEEGKPVIEEMSRSPTAIPVNRVERLFADDVDSASAVAEVVRLRAALAEQQHAVAGHVAEIHRLRTTIFESNEEHDAELQRVRTLIQQLGAVATAAIDSAGAQAAEHSAELLRARAESAAKHTETTLEVTRLHEVVAALTKRAEAAEGDRLRLADAFQADAANHDVQTRKAFASAEAPRRNTQPAVDSRAVSDHSWELDRVRIEAAAKRAEQVAELRLLRTQVSEQAAELRALRGEQTASSSL